MIFYNLMTLSAAAMLDIAVERQKNDKSDQQPEFRYDFNDISVKNKALYSTEPHADNALFYQVIEEKYGKGAVNSYRSQNNPEQADCILKALIYLDFQGVFSPQGEAKDIGKECEDFFKNGFTIVYENREAKSYVPFDKSGNMSRNYKITFIDKALFPGVDERLRLGIDFSSISVVLSKYYAYRGLYLTDGVRLEGDLEHVLDQRSVIVINDDSHDYMRFNSKQEVPVITADKELLRNEKILKIVEKKDSIRLNSFDGEGIVSPQFGEYMNEVRKREVYMRQPAVSFQIRMPYIKGVLHQVDFHSFFKEYLPADDYYIKDIFGIPRRIADARIILTESMFKCTRWLKDYCKIQREKGREITDPMEWFFKMFHQYHHALYICNTDANMGSRKVPLTYQFLNTLALNPQDLEDLVRTHLNEAHSIPKTGDKYAVDPSQYDSETLFEEEDISHTIPAWRYALGLNPDFAKDPHVKHMLEMDENARIKGVCRGRIYINGIIKYLSGDLLAFLIHMIYSRGASAKEGTEGTEKFGLGVFTQGEFRINTKMNRGVAAALKKQLIHSGKFYTADADALGLEFNKRYGLLRSPHLSRNEECSLRPFIPELNDKKNIYNRYFSHLKNVIMLPYESVDAMALGGADYDGDKVELILEGKVNDAILKGAYELQGKDYERKLPLVEIPSQAANSQPVPPVIPYKLIKSTFSNQVGLISNLAIRIGKKEYDPQNTDSSLQNKCAECTLATGLEIDAVKTGVRPDLSELKKASPGVEDYYLKLKERVEEIAEVGRMKVSKLKSKGKHGGDQYTIEKPIYAEGKKTQYTKVFDAELYPIDAPVPNIDRLPGYFLKDLSGEWKSEAKPEAGKESKRPREVLLFEFQKEPSWKKKLQKEPGAGDKLKKVSALVKAYGKMLSDATYIRKLKEKAEQSNNENKIWFLMKKLFDFRAEDLPRTHTAIPDALAIADNDFSSIFKTEAEVNAAIDRMKKRDWFFSSAEERESLLYEILDVEKDDLHEETKEILLCNKPDAFYFLKFYLFAARAEIQKKAPIEEVDFGSRKEPKYVTGYSQEIYQRLFRVYMDAQKDKRAKKDWKSRVVDICREQLAAEDLFSDNFDLALKYYYACKEDDNSYRDFLWDVFRTNEILKNVYKKPRE